MFANVSAEMSGENAADGELKNTYLGKFAPIGIYFFFSIILMICVE